MKNNIINEVTHMKKLMLINEASIIKWKFREGIKPKLNEKLNSLGDNDIKGFNLEVKKESPYRQGVVVTEKIDTKAKLFDELNSLDEIDIKNLTDGQKNFLKELNSRLDDIDPKYIKELAETFKNDFKNSDDLTKGKFLSTFKQLLKEDEYVKFEKEIQGFTIKAGVLPVLKDIIKGSKEFIVPLLKSKTAWGIAILGYFGILIPLVNLLKKGGSTLSEKIDEALKTKGANLFKLLLTNEDILTSNLSSQEISDAYGITEENKAEMDKYAQDFFNTQSWFDTTEDEVKELIKNLTTNFDGINFIYFLSKFEEISSQNFIKFLREKVPNVDNIIFSNDSVNPDFEFLTVMTNDVATLDSINIVMNAVTKSYGGEDGYSQMQIKQDSRNENSEWVPFNNPDSGIILNVINKDGQTINFDYTTRTKIINDLKRYVDGIWSTAGSVKAKEAITNLFNEIIKNKKVPTESNLLELSLDPKTVYTEVSTKLMEEHPEFSKIMFTWPWVQKMNENVVGLARILKEQPVLDKTKKKDNTNVNKNNTSGGGVKTFPGPGTVQQFQDWLDTNYPTWLNGSKLNKGKGYGSYGPSTQKAFTQYGSAYQNSSSNSDGNIQQPETVDKAKEIFDKFNDSVFFYSVNNERMNIEYTQQIGKWIKYYTKKNFNEESSYLGSVLSAYGNMISKYKTDEEIQATIDSQLPNLQTYLKTLFEGIQLKRRGGLSQILEQVSNLVTVNVVNRIPQKQTEDDNYKDMSNVTIKSIIGGGTELRKGDRSDTIVRVKEALKYAKDKTPYFTQDFDTFVINYKGTNKLDNTNGNISKDLMCSIEQYKQLCSTSSGQKTTAPPTNTTSSTPIELKYLNDYATAVGNGIPEYGTCKSLFDYYSEQALNYRRLKKVNKAPQITDVQLKPIKDKILYCQKSSDLKDRAKLDTLISQRFRIQQDKDSPYYLDI
jgi:hypothetical protein